MSLFAAQAPAPTPIRVLIVDDHAVFADLLGFAIEVEPDLVCVGHAASAERALALTRELRPDVVVMDLQLGSTGTEGIDLTRSVMAEHPTTRVVVLTALKDHHLAVTAARAGAVGYLQKDGELVTVIHALRAAHNGLVLLAPRLLSEIGELLPADEAPRVALSDREREVLVLMNQGLAARAISEQLDVSLNTARTHLRNVITKLGAHSQLEALTRARRLGLLDPDASG
jgi:DNA-binding NarL/FixJ family response regulator